MKIMRLLLISLLALPLFGNIAFANSRKDVTTCTSPGADPSGVTDSATAIQNCINSAGGQTALYFPPGTYKIGSTLTISSHYVTLYSDSPASAQLNFTGCGDLIAFSNYPNMIFNGGVRNLFLNGNGSCAQTAIHVSDSSWIEIEDVRIVGFGDASEQSIGIKTNGREGFNVRNAYISANMPIVIGRNPSPTLTYIDADHFHFQNIYSQVVGTGQHWHFTLEDQVTVTNSLIDGQNPMTHGCGILKWISVTPPTSVSYDLKIANVRHEQRTPGCDRAIDIELPVVLQNLTIDNVRLQGPFITSATAIYLRNVTGVTVRNTTFENNPASASVAATFIDAAGTRYIDLQNNYLLTYAQRIVAVDEFGTALVWKAGPYTGKDCCYSSGGSFFRSSDSGILGQP